jgi:hypothetical protein
MSKCDGLQGTNTLIGVPPPLVLTVSKSCRSNAYINMNTDFGLVYRVGKWCGKRKDSIKIRNHKDLVIFVPKADFISTDINSEPKTIF